MVHEYNAEGDRISYDQYGVWDANAGVYGLHNRSEYICARITSVHSFIANGEITVYPNPVNSNFLNVKVNNNARYQIINMLGMVVQSGNIVLGENRIDLPDYMFNDIYIIKISQGNSSVSTHKVIINRM